eukprot:jgi/Chlat1/21/ChrspC228539S00905
MWCVFWCKAVVVLVLWTGFGRGSSLRGSSSAREAVQAHRLLQEAASQPCKGRKLCAGRPKPIISEDSNGAVISDDVLIPASSKLSAISGRTLKSPEFIYGGKWAKSRSKAELVDSLAPTPACHATTLLALSGGKTMAAWFGGSYEGAEDVGIYIAVRDNNDESSTPTWSPPTLAAKVFRDMPYRGKNRPGGTGDIAEPPRQGREPHWNPVLFCGDTDDSPTDFGACKGEILLFFKVGWKIPEWETYITRSVDTGLTWSPPEPLIPGDKGGRGPVKNKPIVLSDGTWLAPASLEGPYEGRSRAWRAFVDRSEDQGKSWVASEMVLPDEEKWGVIQPTLWESEPGHVHMMLRSSKGTDLPNNNSGIDLVKLPRT